MMPDRRLFLSFIVAVAAALATLPVLAADVRRVAVQEDGLVGRLHFLPDAKDRTTVIMLNGSDGGLPSARDADDLAAAGYTVFALAYVKDWQGQPDGVPSSLNEIPLEYFVGAIDWLKDRPQVDRSRIVLMGQSRGAELALLLASIRRDIAGVIAFSPSSHVWNGVTAPGVPADQVRAAWTYDGEPLPFRLSLADPAAPMRQWFERAPAVDAARIRVEDIAGPVLLVSSKVDAVWPAADYADEIAAGLSSRRGAGPVRNLQFDDASHLLMGGGPGTTKLDIPGTTITFDFGGTPEGNARARHQAWQAAKAFLSSIRTRSRPI